LEQAPSLAARKARVEAAELSSRAAGVLPNPMVEFEYRDYNFPSYTIGSDPMSMAGFGVRQDLRSKGRRAAERDIAQAEVATRRAEQHEAAFDLATAVRLQYARLFALDRERDTLENARELVSMLEATTSSRYAAGQSDQASVLRVQLEQSRIGQRLVDIARDRFAAQTAINRLTNDPPERPIGTVTTLPDAALPAAVAAGAAPGPRDAPSLLVRQREVELAGTQVNAARQELGIAWSVGGGFYWQGGFNRTVNFVVGLELPIRRNSKQKPLIASAEQALRASQLELQDATAEVRAETARLVNEWQTATEQIERYQSAILPQNSAAFDATRSSYLAGRGDFVSVLEEFRRWVDVRTELAARQADRYSAVVRLQSILGHQGSDTGSSQS
ncbi:MAG: TolC family protein, partial [Bacteroidales bacterium]